MPQYLVFAHDPPDNASTAMSSVDYEALLVDNLKLLEDVVQLVGRRHRLTIDEAEELLGNLRLKLIENDYDALRRFEGRCSLRTYLTGIAYRLLLDKRNAVWGKWRPSVEARRQGPVALLLERMLMRDKLSFDEAVNALRITHKVEVLPQQLERIAETLPHRSLRRFVGEEALDSLAAGMPQENDSTPLTDDDLSDTARALTAALNELDSQERLVLKLRFKDGMPIVQIARLLALDQKALYRRLDRLKELLRAKLEAQGVDAERVRLILGSPHLELAPVLSPALRPEQ
jgi:RNA polymerase sigma factor (sigma-70 family)